MKLKENLSSNDKTIRFILSVVLFIYAANYLEETLQIVVYVIAAIWFIESLIGYCVLYNLFGINTNKK